MKLTKSAFLFLLAASAHAALTWDTGQGVDNTITSGTGTWDLTVKNWNAINGLGNIAWTNGSDAIFTGGGTITIGASAVSVGAIAVSGTTETVWQGALNNLSFTTVNIGTTGAGKLSIKANTASPANTITGGTINIANGVTLYVATNGQTPSVGSTINVQGTGNTENRGAIRLDGTVTTAVSTLTGSVNLLGNTTIGGSAGALSGIISDGGSGFGISTATTGTGTLIFSGANTYSGKTTIGVGTLSVNSIQNVNGGASALGSVTSVDNGTIGIGSTTTGGTLKYTGGAQNTDRVINLAGTTGGATIDQSGASDLLKFTSAITATGAGSKTLTLQGSTAGTGEIAGAIVDNSGSNITALTKSGTGAWTLSGVNTYTGPTTVNSGTLALTGSAALPSPLITVAGGALFDVSGLTSGGFTLASGKILVAGRAGTPATDVAGSLTVNGGSLNVAGSGTFGTTTINGNLTLNGAQLLASHSGVAGEKVSLTGASRALTLSGTTTVSGFFPPGSHTLIDGYSSVSGSAANLAYTGTARGASGSFTVGASSVTLNVTAGAPLALTWTGTTGGVWDVDATQNWNFDTQKFLQLDNVTFGDSPANSTVTINGAVQPGSIAFTNATTAYIVRGGANPVIAGTGTLTKSAAAQVTLWHTANTYSGGTTISAGTLLLNSGATPATGNYSNSPLGTGLITAAVGGTLQINPGNGGSSTYTFPNALRLNGGTLYHEDGNSVFSGVTTVDAPSLIKTRWGAKNLTLAGGLAGSANLTVSDQVAGEAGTIILGADGTYSGNLIIDNSAGANGAVQLTAANALQNAAVAVNTTAALEGTNPRGLLLGGAADTNFTVGGLSGTQLAATIQNANDANTRTLTVNQSTTTTFSGSIGGSIGGISDPTKRLNLVKSGSGSLTLAGTNTYTGNTTVNAGALIMATGTYNPTADVTVADGATLGLVNNGNSLFIDDLNLGAAGTNTIAITNFTPAGNPAIFANALAKNATTTISLSGTLYSGNGFPEITQLIGYGSKTGAGTFVLAPLPRGVAGVLQDDGFSINLKITGFDSLVWKGTAGSTWDLNTTANWKLGTTNPATYLNGDIVVFDGSATNTTVNLNDTVSPASVSFEFDNPKAYTVGGTGAITGTTSLIKNGTGTLTLATANSYSGSTSVNTGSLVLGNADALGSTLGVTTVADGATLDLNGYSTIGEPYALDGSFLNNGATASTVGGTISLLGDASVGGSGNVIITAPVTGSYSLEKTGTGTLTLTGVNSYAGTTTISGGILVFGTGETFFTYVGGQIDINTGATMQVKQVGSSNRYDFKTQTFNFGVSGGGRISTVGAATNWVAQGNWTFMTNGGAKNMIDGEARINMNGSGRSVVLDVTRGTDPASDLDIAIEIGNTNGNLTKTGNGIATLAAANTYTGNTTVDSGTLNVAAAGRLRFLLGATSGTTNTLSGAGTATLDGGFSIDTTAADGLTSGTWSLETMGATSTYGGGFKVYQADGTTPWTDAGGNKWTKLAAGGNAWTFDEATGTLTLALAAAGFDTWAQQIPNAADRDRSDDPDGDGFTNLQEFLFGKNPIAGDGSLMSSSASGGNLTLRWLQRETGATYTLLESTTLNVESWTNSAVVPQSDAQPGDPVDYDQWKAVIPLGAGKKFFRLEGVETP